MKHDPDRFRRIDALFDAALDLADEERDAFLDRASEGDAELRADVARLLASVRTAESLIGENVAEFAAPLVSGLSDSSPADRPLDAGARLGPWRIDREIGHGGMGHVYLADRDDGEFDMKAAVKVVKRGMDTAEVLRRFRAERRILASLDSPNIARVLDAGATADGRPYLVMEYVDGERIDTWCDTRRLDVRARVVLSRAVCEAVHDAHRQLIVHRDVKPSNVLVTAAGVPKLLDFGIAKLLETDDAETVTSIRMLTPEYAAPEQLHGQPITTATDVYALGRMLFELLVGIRPPRPDTASSTSAREPFAPSAALRPGQRSAGDRNVDLDAIATARATTLDGLRAQLRGDLDTIVLRAIAPEPERRYASALQLAEDLDRWLRGRPVLAQPDSLSYRTRKFVRRNRVPVGAGGLAVLLLIVFAISMTAAQQRTADALQRAERERDTAEETAALLEDIFRSGNPTVERRERLDTLRVSALLERSVERVRAELGDRPAVQARLLRALGDAYRGMGLFDAAEPLLRDAADTYRGLTDSTALAAALNANALLELQRGRSAAAEPFLNEAVAVLRAQRAPDGPTRVRVLANLAAVRQDLGDFDGAAALYAEAQQENEALPVPDTVMLSTLLNGRATLAQRAGDFATAAVLAERILEIDRARLGTEHVRVAIDLLNVGFIEQRNGRLERADSLTEAAVAMIARTVGAEHPMHFSALASLANLRSLRGRRAEARPLFTTAIDGMRRTVGATPDLAITLSHYADLLFADSALVEAETAIVEAIAIERAAFGPTHPNVGVTLTQLARIHCTRDAFASADSLFAEGSAILDSALPAGHPRVLDVRGAHAGCLTRAGWYERAEAMLLPLFEQAGGATNEPAPAARSLARRLAVLYEAWGRPADAARYTALADTSALR